MNKRIVTLAAAFALVATAASAAEVRISVQGKSADQLRSAIAGAARRVCREEYAGFATAYGACVRNTTAESMAQLKQVQLAQAD